MSGGEMCMWPCSETHCPWTRWGWNAGTATCLLPTLCAGFPSNHPPRRPPPQAGLLLAETPFHLQIEADIAPYKGLLMGLFFMTVGMEISMGLLVAKLRTVLAAMVLLIGGKVAVMAGVGQVFGLSLVQSLRAGLLLSPGGEFAFVLFGEAVRGV